MAAILKIKDKYGNIIEIPVIKGDKGDSYVLTEDDKTEIMDAVLEKININTDSAVIQSVSALPETAKEGDVVLLHRCNEISADDSNSGVVLDTAAIASMKLPEGITDRYWEFDAPNPTGHGFNLVLQQTVIAGDEPYVLTGIVLFTETFGGRWYWRDGKPYYDIPNATDEPLPDYIPLGVVESFTATKDPLYGDNILDIEDTDNTTIFRTAPREYMYTGGEWKLTERTDEAEGSIISEVKTVVKDGQNFLELRLADSRNFKTGKKKDFIYIPVAGVKDVTQQSGGITLNGSQLEFGFTGGGEDTKPQALTVSETNTTYTITENSFSVDNASTIPYAFFENKDLFVKLTDGSTYLVFAKCKNGYVIFNGSNACYYIPFSATSSSQALRIAKLVDFPENLTKSQRIVIENDTQITFNYGVAPKIISNVEMQNYLNTASINDTFDRFVLGFSRDPSATSSVLYYYIYSAEETDFKSIYTNVKTFGAIGDGVTDDTQAIQNAIDSVQNGGTIFFPCGTYLLKSVLFNADNSGTAHALRCYSNQRLLFDKGAILKRGSADVTHILFTHNESDATGYNGASNIEIVGATVDANVINNADAITGQCTSFNISHAKNVKITDCTFINGGTSWHSIEINSSRDVVIDSCRFSNNQNSEDIQLDAAANSGNLGTNDGTVTKDIHIKNCIFDITNDAAAIGNHSNAAHCNTRIHDNVFRGGANESRGYIDFVASHEKVDIYNNTFYYGAYGVILKTATTNSAIFNNRFENVATPIKGGCTAFNNIINGSVDKEDSSTGALLDIPEEYTAIAYLESDGSQYIDTEYVPKIASTINFMNWEKVASVTRYQVYAGSCSADNAMDTFSLRQVKETDVLDYNRGGDNGLFEYSGFKVSAARFITLKNTKITVDEETKSLSNVSGTSLDGIYPLYLFACNLAGTPWRNSACRFGTVTFSENNAYVKYLVPCLDSNNVPCYFDRVSGTTLYNAGTGEFLYGEVIQ